MIKIFQIGFHIAGTRSLAKFFENNNFKAFHYENGKLAEQLFRNLNNGYTHFDKPFEGPFKGKQGIFYSDMEKGGLPIKERLKYGNRAFKWEGYKLFKEIDVSYPGSLFILNKRNEWSKRKIKKVKPYNIPKGLSKSEFSEYLAEVEKEHFKNVREYFKGRDNFIEFHIQEDNINKLADWLNSKGFKIKKRKLPKIRG